MKINSFEDMVVWQKGIDLVQLIYRFTKSFPKEELYALSDQMRRSAVSIPSNIAEGQQRNSLNEYIHFLSIAKGSTGELYTQLVICGRLCYLSQEQLSTAIDLTNQISRMLFSLITKLKSTRNQSLQ